MTNKKKRKLFLNTPLERSSEDGLLCNKNADKNCKTCNGHGVLDYGNFLGAYFDYCNKCFK